jgi:hypothetical protein
MPRKAKRKHSASMRRQGNRHSEARDSSHMLNCPYYNTGRERSGSKMAGAVQTRRYSELFPVTRHPDVMEEWPIIQEQVAHDGTWPNSNDQCISENKKGYRKQQNADAMEGVPRFVIVLPAGRRRHCVQ